MPLPLILEVGAIAAGVTGVGSGIHGAVKMKEANDTMEKAKAVSYTHLGRPLCWPARRMRRSWRAFWAFAGCSSCAPQLRCRKAGSQKCGLSA